MRKSIYLLAILSLCVPLLLKAQYGNEWINHSQTYYKFYIDSNGVYRIPKSVLGTVGLDTKAGSTFTIYRNGNKIPVYVTNNGTFSDSDFIEFYAERNNGILEGIFYERPSQHPSTQYSMITNRATYFLVSESGTHPRFTNSFTTIPSPTPTPDAYFWYTAMAENGNRPTLFRAGYDYYSGTETIAKGTFDFGEGFYYSHARNVNANILTPQLYSSATVMANVHMSYGSTAVGSRTVTFKVNGNTVHTSPIDSFKNIKVNTTIASNKLTATNIARAELSTAHTGGFNFVSIEYPRLFNLSGSSVAQLLHKLNTTSGYQYVEYTNVPNLGTGNYLYDLTNNKRYTGNITGTNVAYYLEPSTAARSVYMTAGSEINNITTLIPVNFTNYNVASSQGNYIIITNKDFINAPNNVINQYKNYRSSAAGGGYKVVVADIEEIYDQYYYGSIFNAMSIRNFVKDALDNWSDSLKNVFIIGKGVLYNTYTNYLASIDSYEWKIPIPTFGHPGSDILTVDYNNDHIPEVPIGRLAAWNPSEVETYLNKVKAYEAAINNTNVATIDNTLWKKSALHVAGGDISLQTSLIIPTFNQLTNMWVDSFVGGNVATVRKSTTSEIDPANGVIESTIEDKGIARLTFYGHAFSTGLEYNLNDPDLFNVNPKFPIFYAMGCDVGQMFGNFKSLGEKYLISPNGGSIAFIASNNYGVTGFIDDYLKKYYRQISTLSYGKTLGEQFRNTLLTITENTNLWQIHKHSFMLQGDPALATFNPEKPDYYIDQSLVRIAESSITTATTNTDVSFTIHNLGKATNDSVIATIEHQHPNGSITYLEDTFVVKTKNADSFHFSLPLNSMTDVGLNRLTIKVNPLHTVEEVSMANNNVTVNIIMRDNILRPVYPYEFAIVYNNDLTLHASAFDVFNPNQQFILQIDTTEKFNSPLKKEVITEKRVGGLVKWKPGIILVDNQVYYWRGAVGSSSADTNLVWTNSSFIYIKDGSDGWNQSHYYQYKRNEPTEYLSITEDNRNFNFSKFFKFLEVRNRIWNAENPIGTDIQFMINNDKVDWLGCNFNHTIKFTVIDTFHVRPMPNTGSRFNSLPQCLPSNMRNVYQFEYRLNDPNWRKYAADMIDSIPDGAYVIVSNFVYDIGTNYHVNTTVDYWAGDEALFGAGNTLRDKLISIGFDEIDSFNRKRAFIFFNQKGNPAFEKQMLWGDDENDLLRLTYSMPAYRDEGRMFSTIIGPSTEWKNVLWDVDYPYADSVTDSVQIAIFAKSTTDDSTLVYSGSNKAIDISSIDATQYPNLRMIWFTKDSANKTSANLSYWRVMYQPLPEAALNPHVAFTSLGDSVMEGKTGNISVAIENISNLPMDSMLVNFTITKSDGSTALLQSKRYKPLAPSDTVVASFYLDPRTYPGQNLITVEANPNEDQPEQYHYNNYGYMDLHVTKDNLNPILDVTFDGVHILDKDIVSAKPMIKIMLKDENTFNPINDTTYLKVSIQRPNSTTPEPVIMDGTIATFYPATTSANKNEAYIEYNPELLVDGVYKLIVSGKDVAGNNSASHDAVNYEIQFTVDNKPSVTNLLNYPNPFSTSTAFVFTLTGSEIPSQFKIQILTVTGKVVKEITKQELGPLRIGRNVTEYKWDGRDQYGQLLGNGVYLYRLVTGLNGKSVDHRENAVIDKYFKNGFGKMYIMR